jgi:hypothetical protein
MDNQAITTGSVWVGSTGFDLDGNQNVQTFVVRGRTAKTVTYSAIYSHDNHTKIGRTERRRIASLITDSGRIYMAGIAVTKLA